MNLVNKKYLNSDTLGMASSTLCLIHCLITPIIFIAHACTATCCASAPGWWKAIDVIFLVISFTAVYFSAKTTNIRWVRMALWATFIVLTASIVNEYNGFIEVGRYPLYIAAGFLAYLHLYNRRCCEDPENCYIEDNFSDLS